MSAADAVRSAARPLDGNSDEYDPLLDLIGNARLALLGEASHGTLDFYRERARITRRLIDEKGFSLVAVEGLLRSFRRGHPGVRLRGGAGTGRVLRGRGHRPADRAQA